MNLTALIKKELKHLFYSPVAYVVSGIFLLITGWFFTNALFLTGEAELRGMMDIMPLLLMFFMPAITMRLVAEERKVDTLQLLLTMPVRDWEVVFSKYIAALVLYLGILSVTLIYVIVVSLLGEPDGGVIFSQYLGLVLLGATFIGIGLFSSTITSSQVVAFIVGFSIVFVFFIGSKLQMVLPLWVQAVVERFSMVSRFERILRGVMGLDDLVYFVTVNLFFIMLSTYVLKRRRG
ncbi:MAG: ABC transporter [Nitrospirae bacterium]|nr:MAG: ABC transporter [Nitrospirota bacterium]